MYLPSLIRKTEGERGQKGGDANRIQREAGGGGPAAGDGCDSSQVPKGLEENMALCSDNSVLSGLLRVPLFCSGAHWQACTAPSGGRLKRGGERRKGGGR